MATKKQKNKQKNNSEKEEKSSSDVEHIKLLISISKKNTTKENGSVDELFRDQVKRLEQRLKKKG